MSGFYEDLERFKREHPWRWWWAQFGFKWWNFWYRGPR